MHHKDRRIVISLWPGYKITKETKSKLISSHTDGNYKPNGASEEGTMKHWLSFFLKGSFLTKELGALSWLQTEHLDGMDPWDLGKLWLLFILCSAFGIDARELETRVATVGQHRMCWARLCELSSFCRELGRSHPVKPLWRPLFGSHLSCAFMCR